MSVRAAIFGCGGTTLSGDERAFFRDAAPWGFIVFKRNIETPDQLLRLTSDLRDAVGRDAPILVDQEGGRVQRLGPPFWPIHPPAAVYGRLRAIDPAAAEEVCRLGHRLIGAELRAVGIDVDCVPCVDVPQPGADPIIGDRAFASEPAAIAALGSAALIGLSEAGVAGVMKHIPGHGRADVDSHLALPRVNVVEAELVASDLAPFQALAARAPMAMTAHVVYTAWDPDRPATTSPVVIAEVIRRRIGFDGLLMSDDLSMKALGGSFETRTAEALAAGCDVVLHCNGELREMTAIAASVSTLEGKAAERARLAEAARSCALEDSFDPSEGRARIAALLEPVWAAPLLA